MATAPKKRTSTRKAPGKELAVTADAPVKVASERLDAVPGTEMAVFEAGRLGATLPTHQIQTTMRPDITITVSDDEYQELLAMGLVYSGTPQAPVADGNDLMIADKVQNGTATPAALKAAFVALGQMAASPDLMAVGTITRSSTGAATGFSVAWPDGATGTFTGTESTVTPGAIDSYTVTHVSGGTTTTYTQPALTRDASSGAVTSRPAITVA